MSTKNNTSTVKDNEISAVEPTGSRKTEGEDTLRATQTNTKSQMTFKEQPTQQMSVQGIVQPMTPASGTTGKVDHRKAFKVYYEVEATDRSVFRGIEFLLSCVGLAVGLGNIWRFPMVVYENGGSTFLIPYLLIIFIFAIPSIHMELALGQYAAKSPPAVFRRIMPALEGIGWMSATIVSIIAVYYMILLSWISVYLMNTSKAGLISKCNNPWNTLATCYEGALQKKCSGKKFSKTLKWIYINSTCIEASKAKNVEVSTQQFFTNLVVGPSKGLTDINTLNWSAFAALAVCWLITAIILIRGMKTISKLSYVTAILPYFIIIILLARGATLEGAGDGLYFFLWKSDFRALLKFQTWSEAMSQACFSLSIGIGGLMNTASYNKRTYNWYRDAFLIVIFDTCMSLLGGVAVFSTLGFLAKQRGVTVPEVVKTGPHLAFVVYTEAISQMPIPWLWYGLFFIMLFLLGIGTEIVFVETVCSCLIDRFRPLRKHRWALVLAVCTVFFACGIVMTTDAGYYWFQVFDEYSGGVSAAIGSTMTCLAVCYCYGLTNFRDDIKEMWGEPHGFFNKHLGPASVVWTVSWYFTAPIISCICIFLMFSGRDYPFKGDSKMYPPLFDIFGWTVAFIPFLVVPLCAIVAIVRFNKMKIPLAGVFMIQRQHPSYDRISDKWPESKRVIGDQLPDQEPGEEQMEMVDGSVAENDNESVIE